MSLYWRTLAKKSSSFVHKFNAARRPLPLPGCEGQSLQSWHKPSLELASGGQCVAG